MYYLRGVFWWTVQYALYSDLTGIDVRVSVRLAMVFYWFSTTVHVLSVSSWYSRTHYVPMGKVTLSPLTW